MNRIELPPVLRTQLGTYLVVLMTQRVFEPARFIMPVSFYSIWTALTRLTTSKLPSYLNVFITSFLTALLTSHWETPRKQLPSITRVIWLRAATSFQKLLLSLGKSGKLCDTLLIHASISYTFVGTMCHPEMVNKFIVNMAESFIGRTFMRQIRQEFSPQPQKEATVPPSPVIPPALSPSPSPPPSELNISTEIVQVLIKTFKVGKLTFRSLLIYNIMCHLAAQFAAAGVRGGVPTLKKLKHMCGDVMSINVLVTVACSVWTLMGSICLTLAHHVHHPVYKARVRRVSPWVIALSIPTILHSQTLAMPHTVRESLFAAFGPWAMKYLLHQVNFYPNKTHDNFPPKLSSNSSKSSSSSSRNQSQSHQAKSESPIETPIPPRFDNTTIAMSNSSNKSDSPLDLSSDLSEQKKVRENEISNKKLIMIDWTWKTRGVAALLFATGSALLNILARMGYASNAWLVGLLFGNLQKIAAKYTGFEVKKSSTLS